MSMFDRVPHEFLRTFVVDPVDYSSWRNLEPLFKDLEQRDLSSVQQLERWLADRSELLDVINEEAALRYIRMTCNTENKDLEIAYLHFLEKIAENLKSADHRLKMRYTQATGRIDLPRSRYYIFDRSAKNDVELFRQENIPLETEESKLSQKYQKLMGSLAVSFDGREQTLQQMRRYLEYTEHHTREAAWTTIAERRLQEREALEDLFARLLKVRIKIAENSGFDSYRDYAFRHLERFDYTPEHCFQFHEGIEATVVPLARKLQQKRAKQLGLDRLRPWDLHVDPENRPPLEPFTAVEELVDGCVEIARRVNSRFGEFLEKMKALRLLDLESRKGKAPGGYQSSLTDARLPFIFMNAVGLDSDVRTLLHESGHALHVFATRQEPLGHYRHAPIEFCEVASMSMELLGGNHLQVFYPDPQDDKRSKKRHLEVIVDILPWIAQVDAFQHWIYTHPEHSVEEREQQWLALHHRFGGIEDWSGFEQAQRSSWQRQLHIFEMPFYYIEYAIAQLGALQVWINASRDHQAAVSDYWSALELGGSRTLPKLFERASIKFDFGPEALKPLMKAVEEALDGY